MAVPVSTDGAFTRGRPQILFEAEGLGAPWRFRVGTPNYDVSVDGQRFLTPLPSTEEQPPRSMRLVQNWVEGFRNREQD
jgi:hypothetical protein